MYKKQFRGKRKDNGKWVYWNSFGEIMDKTDNTPCFYVYQLKHLLLPETIGMFVFLDEDGNEVFEGDIINAPFYYDEGCYPYTEHRLIVVKVPDFYRLKLKGVPKGVLGNVYDNPELAANTI